MKLTGDRRTITARVSSGTPIGGFLAISNAPKSLPIDHDMCHSLKGSEQLWPPKHYARSTEVDQIVAHGKLQ
jgi:hypothetical protein